MSPTDRSNPKSIFREFLNRLGSGEDVSLDDLVAEHPQHSDELRKLWERAEQAAEGELERALGPLETLDSIDAVQPGDSSGELSPDPATAALFGRLARRDAAASRYREEREIARGGMGRILEVWDEDLRRTLAMKTMRSGTEVQPGMLDRFLEESQVTAQLAHPGVPPVHELGLDSSGNVYFTMQMVHGRDFQQILGLVREGREGWTRTRAVGVLQRVCETMAFAHAKNVIHRDLKPANVMVGAFGEVYVMDWGLAKVGASEASPPTDELPPVRTNRAESSGEHGSSQLLTVDGAVMGTPSFMSPEQALGRLDELGPRSDVYSAGAMLYHLLTGSAPYASLGSDRGAAAIVMAVREGPPPGVDRLAPDVPAELASICEKAMARDLEHRYPDMRSMADDLRAYLENRVVTAHRTGAWVEFRKWVQRNRATAASLLGVLVAVLSGAGGVSYVFAEGKKQVETERDRYQGLSDVKRVRETLRAGAEEFWPPLPESLEAMREWMTEATVLLDRVGLHRENLDMLEERGYESEAAPEGAHPGGEERLFFETWNEAYEHEVLVELMRQLDDLPELIDAVEGRRDFAASVEHRTLTGADAVRRWTAARADIAAAPTYGFDLPPQLGLLPLRKDPDSELWEFWHLLSGAEPVALPEGGYELAPETGIVLVLLPGGSTTLGSILETAENRGEPYVDSGRDAAVDADEGLHDVTLNPFFLSKYELTQAQWERSDLQNRSSWVDPLNPVEATFYDAAKACARLGLILPTEAQWEYACRGGTTTQYSTGPTPATLQDHANLADVTRLRLGEPGAAEIDDGAVFYVQVGSYLPNPFGLHDMHGNVWELCLDPWYGDPAIAPRDGDGLRGSTLDGDDGAVRGGSWFSPSADLRSANRFGWSREAFDQDTGLRPARAVERP